MDVLQVSAAAALIATGCSHPIAPPVVGVFVMVLQYPLMLLLGPVHLQYIRATAALCVSFLVAFRYLPLVFAPPVAAAVFFPSVSVVSFPAGLVAAASALLLGPGGRAPELYWPVSGDVIVAVCAAVCVGGAAWRRILVSVVWGTILFNAHPGIVAVAVVASGAHELADVWKLFESHLIHLTIPSSSAAQMLFVISCSSVAAAVSGVQPGALAVLYVLVGFAVCFGIGAVVVLGVDVFYTSPQDK